MTGGDRGTQPERTALSWQRTGLSAAVVAVLLVRTGIVRGSALAIAGGAFAAVVVLLSVLAAREVPSTRTRLILVTVAVVATGVCVAAHLLAGYDG
jgi:ABC-type enterobactin transport system permease subunit